MRLLRRHTLVLGFAALALPVSCTSAPVLTSVAGELAKSDVVFFGEIHDNDVCHEQQRQMLVALRKVRPDIVVSMEMFERDVQEHLDAYLAGKMEPEEFRKKARAWKNWHHYQPIVQIALAHSLPVIAANAPTELVRRVSRNTDGGLAGLAGNAHVAREILTPKDAYYASIVEQLKGHAGAMGPDGLTRFYEAQCVRDETMAESISDYLESARAEGRRPLVYHLCGNGHSNKRLGTVQRLLRRQPDLAVSVIETKEVENSEGAVYEPLAHDFRLLVVKQKRKPVTVKVPAKPEEKKKAEEIDPDARPGLGFMPGYNATEIGCVVDRVSAGGAAEKAGIEDGDVIVKLHGDEIDDVRSYMEVLNGLKVGQKVKVSIKRDGKTIDLDVVVGQSFR